MPTTPLLLTDSGLETWLIFLRGVDLPDFASFPLLETAEGRALLTEYFRDHLRVAEQAGTGVVLETPTWRANPDWGARLGHDAAALDSLNQGAVLFLRSLGEEFPTVPLIVSGNVGPRGDGYNPVELLTPDDAAAYHRPQIDSFVAAGADRVTMLTATHTGEAIGVVRAAVDAGIPDGHRVHGRDRRPARPAGSRCTRPSPKSTPRPTPPRSSSASTPRTPITSRLRLTPTPPRSDGSVCCAPTHRA